MNLVEKLLMRLIREAENETLNEFLVRVCVCASACVCVSERVEESDSVRVCGSMHVFVRESKIDSSSHNYTINPMRRQSL